MPSLKPGGEWSSIGLCKPKERTKTDSALCTNMTMEYASTCRMPENKCLPEARCQLTTGSRTNSDSSFLPQTPSCIFPVSKQRWRCGPTRSRRLNVVDTRNGILRTPHLADHIGPETLKTQVRLPHLGGTSRQTSGWLGGVVTHPRHNTPPFRVHATHECAIYYLCLTACCR